MAVNTPDDFIEMLEKSSLLNAARVDEARRLVQGLTEPAAIARKLVQQNLISRWQAQQLLAGRHSLFISKYRLLDLLGQDAVGPIYLAEHTQMDRRVILKTLARREGNSSAAVEKFLSETAALATLDHRHLCHIYDVDREGDFYYLVMEHVQGRNLQQVVESDGPMSCESAAGLMGLAADAMGHAHRQGILHLGLRPDRLVVDGQGTIKVLDIGVARLADKESPDGSSIRQADKYSYQAPEQISGAGPPDARMDVFALGSVLYLLLTGEPPKLNGERQSLDIRGRRRDVPVELAQICQKMMALQPQDRYPTATEAAIALESWLQQAETARAAVRAKAAAAKPRTGGTSEKASNGEAETRNSPVAIQLNSTPTASGAQLVVPRKSPDRLKLMLGGGIGVGLVAIIVVTALLLRGSGTTPSKSTIVAATTGGKPSAPPTNTNQIPEDGEPIVRHLIPISTKGAVFLTQLEGVVLVDGNLPAGAKYEIIAKSEEPSIAGLRVEVLSHMLSKGGSKPARFRLSEIKIETANDEKFTKPDTVKVVQANSDYLEPGMSPSKAIDGNRKTHWGADSKASEDHWATFWFDNPLTAKKDAPRWFRVTLDQADKGFWIYEFRLSTVTGKRPEPVADTSLEPLPAIAEDALPELAYWRFEKPAAAAGAAEGRSPAVEDVSDSRNHLYLPAGGEPVHFDTEVASATVRRNGKPNVHCLDYLQPAKGKGAARGLVTVANRSPRDLASQRLDTWTVEASFLVEKLGGPTHTILGKDGPPKAGGKAPLQLRVRGDSDLVEIAAIDSTRAPHQVESTEAVVPGRWYHVVAASDGKQLRLWVDAGDGLKLQGHDTFSGALAQGPGEWSVGRGYSDGQPAHDAQMLIDEVRITAAAREPTDMLMYATPADLVAEKAATVTRGGVVAPSRGPIKFHPLKILGVQPEGVEFQPQDDGSLLVAGPSPEKAVYTIRAHTDVKGISGIRLEAMADYRLPGKGPGRHESEDKNMKGNFVVTSLSVTAAARESERRPALIAWREPETDFSQDKFNVASLIDKKVGDGWAIAPAVGKGHYAMLTAERSVGYPGGTWLTITIEQNYGQKLTLGRFRLTAFTGDKPGEEKPEAGVRAADQFAHPLTRLLKVKGVTLPALPAEGSAVTKEATAAFLIGPVFRYPGTPVVLGLLGGETAVDAEGASFGIERDEKADDKSPRWKFLFKSDQTASGAPLVVAEAGMFGNELKFHWTEQGAQQPLANHLRNCVLEVRVGGRRGRVALREPEEVEQRLDLGFGHGTNRPRFEVPWPPKTAALKFVLPAKQAGFPPYAISHETAGVGKRNIEITFSEQGQPDLIATVDASLKKTFQFAVDNFISRGENKRQPYNRSSLEKLKRKWTGDLAKQQAFVARSKDPTIKQNAMIIAQRMEAEVKGWTRVLDRADQIEKAGGLPVEVFLQVEDFRVVLLHSKKE